MSSIYSIDTNISHNIYPIPNGTIIKQKSRHIKTPDIVKVIGFHYGSIYKVKILESTRTDQADQPINGSIQIKWHIKLSYPIRDEFDFLTDVLKPISIIRITL